MKVLIIVASFLAVASATKTHYGAPAIAVGAPLAPVAVASTGSSSQFRSEDNYGNFNFGYDESHASGSTSRREEEHNGVRRGSYSLSDADGRSRLVTYIADANGFRATVQSNEPGVEPKDPADVLINKAAPVAVVAAPAPVAIAAPLPAPVYQQAPVAVKSIVTPVQIAERPRVLVAPTYSAPAAAAVIEAPAPRAFSYSFGASHLAAAAPAYAPVAHRIAAPVGPIAAPAPIFQQRLEY